MDRDDLVAAPPDDGGHRGVFSLPSDELQVPDGARRHPPTDWDPAEAGGRGSGISLLGWALFFAIVTAYFVALHAC